MLNISNHAVADPTKATTKVRIVYDASAKTKQGNTSLNECLFRGSVIIQNLTGILFRFRMNPIALVADIEKSIHKNNIQTYRFCRVPFGITCSTFFLAATIGHHLKHSGSCKAKNIRDNIYVDNVITGTQSIYQANEFYSNTKALFENASMN